MSSCQFYLYFENEKKKKTNARTNKNICIYTRRQGVQLNRVEKEKEKEKRRGILLDFSLSRRERQTA